MTPKNRTNKRFLSTNPLPDSAPVFLSLKGDVAGVNRVCPRCGEGQPIESFAVDWSKSSGLKSHCKRCDSARSREYRAKRDRRSREW